mgnify:CR=1 FL=1
MTHKAFMKLHFRTRSAFRLLEIACCFSCWGYRVYRRL